MSDPGVTVSGWNKLSFIDFPGKAASVLFFAGCNLRCPYCHNPCIVRNEFPSVDLGLVKEYLIKRRDFVEGVVLSGGEPTIHAGLPVVVLELRALDLKIKLDTNGLLPDAIARCDPDYLALDIKTIPSRYGELGYSGAEAESRLRRSIEIVKVMGKRAEIRITAVPRFVDGTVMRELAKIIAGAERVFIQPYRNDIELLDPEFAKVSPYSIEQIQELRNTLAPAVGECSVRGDEKTR